MGLSSTRRRVKGGLDALDSGDGVAGGGVGRLACCKDCSDKIAGRIANGGALKVLEASILENAASRASRNPREPKL